MKGSVSTYRSRLAFWLFVGSFAPAFAVLVTFVAFSAATLDLRSWLGMLWLPALALAVAAAGLAAVVSHLLASPVQRLRSLAALASRRLLSTPARMLDSDRSLRQYAETASIAQSIRRLHERLGEENSKRDRVAAYVAHDIRTPIAALVMRVENDERVSDEARVDLLARVKEVLDDLDRLVMALRGGAGIQASPSSDGPVRVSEVVRASLPRATVKDGVNVEVIVRRDFNTSMAGPALRSVVENLLSNAVRHADAGVSVEVGLGYLRVANAVAAGGEVSSSRVLEAHGLGLEIVRHVLENNGGRLKLDDRAGGIVEVIAYLPFTSECEVSA